LFKAGYIIHIFVHDICSCVSD